MAKIAPSGGTSPLSPAQAAPAKIRVEQAKAPSPKTMKGLRPRRSERAPQTGVIVMNSTAERV